MLTVNDSFTLRLSLMFSTLSAVTFVSATTQRVPIYSLCNWQNCKNISKIDAFGIKEGNERECVATTWCVIPNLNYNKGHFLLQG